MILQIETSQGVERRVPAFSKGISALSLPPALRKRLSFMDQLRSSGFAWVLGGRETAFTKGCTLCSWETDQRV